MRLSEDEHAAVSAAVARAEAASRGEIVTIVARRSDKYHDVALHWAVIVMLGALAVAAALPETVNALFDPWRAAPSTREMLTAVLIAEAAVFLLAALLLRSPGLRMALTPPATKTRRVRARALDLFRAGAERRTTGRTGVLLYLSLAEQRAEIVADAAIHGLVAPEAWGEAMAALLGHVRAGRLGEGMVAAIDHMGGTLAMHLPPVAGDVNEVPDRLIEL